MDKKATLNNIADSIDNLAKITKEEFEKVDKNFTQVNSRLGKLERNMDEIKLKFAYTAWAIDMEELKKRVITIEQKIGVKQKGY